MILGKHKANAIFEGLVGLCLFTLVVGSVLQLVQQTLRYQNVLKTEIATSRDQAQTMRRRWDEEQTRRVLSN
jgi:hypothetical protein